MVVLPFIYILGGTLTFLSEFILVASTNPCPCGYYGDGSNNCSCSPTQVKNYLGKISGSLFDRIDLHIWIKLVKFEEITEKAEREFK